MLHICSLPCNSSANRMQLVNNSANALKGLAVLCQHSLGPEPMIPCRSGVCTHAYPALAGICPTANSAGVGEGCTSGDSKVDFTWVEIELLAQPQQCWGLGRSAQVATQQQAVPGGTELLALPRLCWGWEVGNSALAAA